MWFLKAVEKMMAWWIGTVPTWAQPRAFWTGYFLVLDRVVREER